MHLLFGFSGRTGRGGWWLGQFALIAVSLACAGAIFASQGLQGLAAAADGDVARLSASMVAMLFSVTVLTTWMAFAVTIKRFHDRDKSGFWCLIVFVPLIGPLWQLVECGFLSGSPDSNRFGPPGGSGAAGLADRLDVGSAYTPPSRENVEPVAIAATSEAGRPRRQTSHAFGRRTR